MADGGTAAYGPNSAEVRAFIDRVRRLTPAEGSRIRHAYVDREEPPDEAGLARADVTLTVIRAAVDARLKDEHRRAIEDCRQALAASGAGESGMGVHIGDLAGSLVVRDRLAPGVFDFMASGWRAALGNDATIHP